MRASPLVYFAVTFFLLANLKARTWTSRDGKTMEAEFVKAVGDKVTIKRSDGKVFSVDLKKFSEEDRKFVAQKLRENTKGEKGETSEITGKISDPKEGDEVEHEFTIKGRTRGAPKGFVVMLFSRNLQTKAFFPQHEYTDANRSFTLKIYHPPELSGKWEVSLYALPEVDAKKLAAWHMKSAGVAKAGQGDQIKGFDQALLKNAVKVASVQYSLKEN